MADLTVGSDLKTTPPVFAVLVDKNGNLIDSTFPIPVTLQGPANITAELTGMPGALDEGTVTTLSGTTLSDSSKKWEVNCWTGYLVRVKTGTGIGQVRTITANTANQLTVATWTTNPLAGDTYEIFEANKTVRGPIINHRVGITSADKVVSPTLVTLADQAGVAGALTAVSHGAAVAAGNTLGTAGTSNILTATPTVNKTLDLTIPQATGATYYDVFCSTATTAPLWVARITEAQRAAGCAITAVGTVGAGGSAGVVNIRLVGTGIANTAAPFAQNNAYIPTTPEVIDCTGKKTAFIHVTANPTDLRAIPALNIVPFLSRNEGTPTVFFQGKQQILQPLAALGYSLMQGFSLDVEGAKGLVVLVGTVTNASVSIDVELV